MSRSINLVKDIVYVSVHMRHACEHPATYSVERAARVNQSEWIAPKQVRAVRRCKGSVWLRVFSHSNLPISLGEIELRKHFITSCFRDYILMVVHWLCIEFGYSVKTAEIDTKSFFFASMIGELYSHRLVSMMPTSSIFPTSS